MEKIDYDPDNRLPFLEPGRNLGFALIARALMDGSAEILNSEKVLNRRYAAIHKVEALEFIFSDNFRLWVDFCLLDFDVSSIRARLRSEWEMIDTYRRYTENTYKFVRKKLEKK